MSNAVTASMLKSLKAIATNGGKVLVLGVFSTDEKNTSPMGLAVEVTQALIDDLQRLQAVMNENQLTLAHYKIGATRYDWLMKPAPANLTADEQEDWEISMAEPKWVLGGLESSFWLVEDFQETTISTRMLSLEVLRAVLSHTEHDHLVYDPELGAYFCSEYFGGAGQLRDELKATGFVMPECMVD